MTSPLPRGVMLNAYPDSIGGRLSDIVDLLERPEFAQVFSLFYVLPTMFNSDLDRGFSVIDYDLNTDLVNREDLARLDALGVLLKVDLVLNHLSVGSPQFADLLERGDESAYRDFFVDWNEFWANDGQMGPDGYVIPDQHHLDRLFMRKPGLPILQVRFPDGSDRFYWNTFYQQVTYEPGAGGSSEPVRTYLGQMDLNARSELVWDFYRETLTKLAGYGVRILRLDAFAYLHKQVGESNFFNRPGTWDYLNRLDAIADELGFTLLPEIHSEYGSAIHTELAEQGFAVYDFFLPGLVIDAIDNARSGHLIRWIREVLDQGLSTVNMLGCHDGIPVIDLKSGTTADGETRPGLLADSDIEAVIERLIERGGRIKNLYGPDGTKVSYYQVNATFFSALGEDEQRLRLARAIQLFMPGVPQIWYLDLFAGANDNAAADLAGEGGHKEINRTNLSMSDVDGLLGRPVVTDQLAMIRLRNTSPAFDGELTVNDVGGDRLGLTWTNGDVSATLDADLATCGFTIAHRIGGEVTEMVF